MKEWSKHTEAVSLFLCKSYNKIVCCPSQNRETFWSDTSNW